VDIIPFIRAARHASHVAVIGNPKPIVRRNQKFALRYRLLRAISLIGGDAAGSPENMLVDRACNRRAPRVNLAIATIGSFGSLPEVRYQCPQSMAINEPPSTKLPKVKLIATIR